MSNKDTTCTINGLRLQKLPKMANNETLLRKIEEEIRQTIFQGYNTFQTGMTMGVDIWAAEIILRLKTEVPDIQLVCFQPCDTQANNWPEFWREKYFDILAASDDVICLQRHYTAGCMQRRNRKMIDSSSCLIAGYDDLCGGGTAHTISYAKKEGLNIVTIDPLDFVR